MRRTLLALLVLAVTLPVAAQTPEQPPPPPPPPTTPVAPAEPPPPPKPAGPPKWFFGGGFGASFGTVDTISVAPLIGYHVVPRVDVGLQPYYSWVNDDRYSPSLDLNEYGAFLLTRLRVYRTLFLEADYQHTNYEFPTVGGGTDRDTYNAFLAGGGYGIPIAGRASMYVSALYDFSYDSDDPFLPYDGPWRFQVGVMVGF